MKKSRKGSFNTQKFSITLGQDEILPASPFNNLLPPTLYGPQAQILIFSLDPLLSQNNSIHSGAEQKNIGFRVGVGFLQLSFLLGENSSCNISFILHIRLCAYIQNTAYFIYNTFEYLQNLWPKKKSQHWTRPDQLKFILQKCPDLFLILYYISASFS